MKQVNSNPDERKPRTAPIALIAVTLSGALAVVGCEPQAEEEAVEPPPAVEEQQVEPGEGLAGEEEPVAGEEEVEGEVIEREIRPGQEEDIGQREVEEGEAEVTVRRRVVVRQLEELEVPTVRVCEEYADLNELSVQQLVALGVSENAAQSIVQYREEQGPFRSMDQLGQVQGVDQQTMQQLRDIVAVPQAEQQQ